MSLRLAGLWRNRDFAMLWAAQTVSTAGSLLGALSLTALLYLHASPAQLGVLYAAQGLPALLFTLFAGVWVDRLPRRPVLVLSDIGRAVCLLSVPLAAAFGVLRMEQLYAVAFLAGGLDVAFRLAYRSYLPALVNGRDLLEGNAKLSASESVMEVGAPAVGGGLVQASTGPVAVLIDALTFLLSAAFLSRIRRSEPRHLPQRTASAISEIAEGLDLLWRHRVLRGLAGSSGTLGFFGGFFHTLYFVFLIETLHFSPLAAGITVGAGGIGSLAGAMLAERLVWQLRLGRALLLTRSTSALITFLIPLAPGPKELAFAMILFAQLAGDALWTAHDVSAVSLRQTVVPRALLGRVTAGGHVLEYGLLPIGALVGGLLAEIIGVRQALLLAAAGMACGLGWLISSPIPGLRSIDVDIPTEGTPEHLKPAAPL
jgi:predicted MFS family arabinose efflux permease